MTRRQAMAMYFPAWKRASRRQRWNLQEGRRAAARLEHWGCGEVDELYQAVWDLARKAGGLVPEESDFRHACNLIVSGMRTESSDQLRGWEVGKFAALCDLLADPDDVKAAMDYQMAFRRSCYWVLSHQPPAKLNAIARDIWKVEDYKLLSDEQLLSLTRKFAKEKE